MPLLRRLLGRPLFPCSESSRPEVIRCLEKHRRGGSRGRRVRSVDGVFRGVATWNPGIRVSRGSLGRSSIDSQLDTPSSGAYLARYTQTRPPESFVTSINNIRG